MQIASTPWSRPERQRARQSIAQLGSAAVGVVPRLGASKHAVEMDVGNVEELHGAKNRMWRVGRTAVPEQRLPRRSCGWAKPAQFDAHP